MTTPTPPALSTFASDFSIHAQIKFPKNHPSSMRTIASNKRGGCAADAGRNGVALYINSWDTSDGRLVFEYGTSMSGCNKVVTPNAVKYSPDGWVGVGVTYEDATKTISLFVDGVVQVREMTSDKVKPQTIDQDVHIGVGVDDDSTFFGQISTFVVFGTALDEENVRYVNSLRADSATLKSHYTTHVQTLLGLDEPDKKKPGLVPRDISDFAATNSRKGQFHFQATSNFMPEGGGRFEDYKDGTGGEKQFTQEVLDASDEKARGRRAEIKASMQHVWAGYRKYAFGFDELKPLSKKGHNPWGGMGTTLVDSLDTLWLMGMKDEFWEGRDWVRDHLSHDHVGSVSFFETTIRSLGGLLAAYDWSDDKVFLDKALDLGTRLAHAFESPSGLPYGQTTLNGHHSNNAGWTGGSSLLAEIGTVQVEFRYLAKATGIQSFADKANKVFEIMHRQHPNNGLYPIYVSSQDGHFTNNKITFGAMGDSFYEYMIKCWLQGDKTEPEFREMWDESMAGVHKMLAQKSSPSGLSYIADLNGGRLDHKMDHLVCFMGGALALGAYTDPEGLDSPRAQRDLKLAKAVTYTCYQMYARMATGIAPEFVRFENGKDMVAGSNAPFYILRPETVESFFILNKLTGDPVYREWGWEVYQAIEKYCRTEVAYGGIDDVRRTGSKPTDRMESFFLAETMKYLYLLQDPDTEVDILNKHVFNTEAHPLRKLELVKKRAS
ncbi:hypothetical protein TrVE_jg12329 [Triparma verrucosa]|uniref:alpha-1,2-Mannosidase n=1 Tax=Triparma verrucosa TaxID=1606542 RepID=A0A9W7C5V4_9STRA|nr:hypothetical protein TrVE_jg12329 [Triparma verrucosa]